MDKISKESLEKFSDIQLNKVKILAYLPTGAFGIHDFMIGRKSQGVLHIVISLFIFLFCNGFGEMVCKSTGNCTSTDAINTFYSTTPILGMLFLAGSWIWAITEGDKIDHIVSERSKTPEQRAEEVRETVEEAGEAEEYEAKAPERKREDQRAFSIASVVIGTIAFAVPLLFFLFLGIYLSLNPEAARGGGGIVAMLIGPFIWLVEPVLAVLAIVFGIKGIGKKENQKIRLLPFLGILLGVLLIVALGVFIFWPSVFLPYK